MTRTKYARTLVSLSAILALAGCGGGGLTASGQATVTDSTGTVSGFHFPAGVRLDGAAGTTTGVCQISRGSGAYGVVVDLYGDSQGVGHAVRSMTIMAHSDAPTAGHVTADLGGTEFSTPTSCQVDVTGIDEGRGEVTLTANACAIAHGTETATANVQISLSGCQVI